MQDTDAVWFLWNTQYHRVLLLIGKMAMSMCYKSICVDDIVIRTTVLLHIHVLYVRQA